MCYDEERWVETNKRNCEPTIMQVTLLFLHHCLVSLLRHMCVIFVLCGAGCSRTCPVNDKILAEWAAEQAADEQVLVSRGPINRAQFIDLCGGERADHGNGAIRRRGLGTRSGRFPAVGARTSCLRTRTKEKGRCLNRCCYWTKIGL